MLNKNSFRVVIYERIFPFNSQNLRLKRVLKPYTIKKRCEGLQIMFKLIIKAHFGKPFSLNFISNRKQVLLV